MVLRAGPESRATQLAPRATTPHSNTLYRLVTRVCISVNPDRIYIELRMPYSSEPRATIVLQRSGTISLPLRRIPRRPSHHPAQRPRIDSSYVGERSPWKPQPPVPLIRRHETSKHHARIFGEQAGVQADISAQEQTTCPHQSHPTNLLSRV